MSLLAPILFALLAWWLGTLLVIWLDGLPPRTFRWSLAGATLLLLLGFGLAGQEPARDGMSGAYGAFLGGFLVWAWQEVSFYTGFVTGPRKHPCPPGCRGWRHFGHALQVSLWHELAILASAGALWWGTSGTEHRFAFLTFALLWFLHETARISVFLGVRNISAPFLPEHLSYLSSFLRVRRMNAFLPLAILASAGLTAWLTVRALDAGDPAVATGWGLLAGLALLGVLEHLFLVAPIPLDRLWAIGLRLRARDERG